MGTSCAPTAANIYMTHFEKTYIYNEIPPFYEAINHWARCIGEIFFIWCREPDSLHDFLEWINHCDINLKFTANLSNQKIEFLDIEIKDHNYTLEVDLYVKPTARNTLLYFNSYHPKTQKESIPFGQYLRLHRNCTNLSDYDNRSVMMFTSRVYPRRLV